MSSIADNVMALQVMNDANKDFLEFINNLREFLNGDAPVTFNIDTGDGPTTTVNSLMKLISDYKNGVFSEIVLGGPDSSTQIKLSVGTDSDNNPVLKVSDMNGNLVDVSCKKLDAAIIENCTVKTVTADACNISSVTGSVSVIGGSVNLDSLNINNKLTVTELNTPTVNTQGGASVTGNISCAGMTIYGARKLNPQNVRSAFMRDGTPIDNAASMYSLNGDNWVMYGSGNLSPKDVGFVQETSSTNEVVAADLITIAGDNKYSDFTVNDHATFIPNNVVASVALPNTSTYTTIAISGFATNLAALLLWPSGSYTLLGNGVLNLKSFARADIGKEIYYQVLGNTWKIYRYMEATYNGTTLESVKFRGLTELPKYSCTRFIMQCHDSIFGGVSSSSGRSVIYSLEFS